MLKLGVTLITVPTLSIAWIMVPLITSLVSKGAKARTIQGHPRYFSNFFLFLFCLLRLVHSGLLSSVSSSLVLQSPIHILNKLIKPKSTVDTYEKTFFPCLHTGSVALGAYYISSGIKSTHPSFTSPPLFSPLICALSSLSARGRRLAEISTDQLGKGTCPSERGRGREKE